MNVLGHYFPQSFVKIKDKMKSYSATLNITLKKNVSMSCQIAKLTSNLLTNDSKLS